MDAEKFEVRIKSIQENAFSIDEELLIDQTDTTDININFLINFKYDANKSLFITNSTIAFILKEKELVRLSFSFIVEIKNIQSFIIDEKKDKCIDLPDEFMETIISDVYATGRSMAHDRLSATILKDEYLPLGGAVQIFEMFKEKPKIKYMAKNVD